MLPSSTSFSHQCQLLTCPSGSEGCFLPGLGTLGPCSTVLSSGAAGLGCPWPGPAAAGASAAWGQGSASRGPYGLLGLSWASSTLRVKGISVLTFSVCSLEGAGAVGRCPWSFSLAAATSKALSSAWLSLVPAHSAWSSPGLLPLGIFLRVACALLWLGSRPQPPPTATPASPAHGALAGAHLLLH